MLRNTENTTLSPFERLLQRISFGYSLNRSELNEDVVQARDDVGTLLHHAAKLNHARNVELLIELGSKVNLFVAGQTPLMLAVESVIHRRSNDARVVEALLRANTNAELTNDEGQSALTMALKRHDFDSGIQAFVRNFLANDRTNDEIAEILINAGGNMYHAVQSKDIELMGCMLERGIDVNSKSHWSITGLHEAACTGDNILVEWLIDHGANVNAIDEVGESPLISAAWVDGKDTMKILLEHSADPNLKTVYNPLYVIFGASEPEDVEGLELLLQYGAIPQNSRIFGTIFDRALNQSSDKAIWIMISHLAMLEKRGVPIDKSVIRCENVRHESRNPEFERFYETCLRVLETPVLRKLSLADLLNSESRLQSLVRNEEFVAEMRKVCSERELKKLNSYYYKRVMERIDKAIHVVTLQNEVIPVVCKLFEGNYHECYVFARKMVDYLDICDLEKLAKTFQT